MYKYFSIFVLTFLIGCNWPNKKHSKRTTKGSDSLHIDKKALMNDSGYYAELLSATQNKDYHNYTYSKDQLESLINGSRKGNCDSYGDLMFAYYCLNKSSQGLGISFEMAANYDNIWACYNIYEILMQSSRKASINNKKIIERIALYHLFRAVELGANKNVSSVNCKDGEITINRILKESFGEGYLKYNSKQILFDSTIHWVSPANDFMR
jgi:hypothetical protein